MHTDTDTYALTRSRARVHVRHAPRALAVVRVHVHGVHRVHVHVQVEDWLYDDGADTTKAVYVAKLDELKADAAAACQLPPARRRRAAARYFGPEAASWRVGCSREETWVASLSTCTHTCHTCVCTWASQVASIITREREADERPSAFKQLEEARADGHAHGDGHAHAHAHRHTHMCVYMASCAFTTHPPSPRRGAWTQALPALRAPARHDA